MIANMRWYERPRQAKGENSEGWRSRGYLPHFDHEDCCQFVTFSLHDALPNEVTLRIEAQVMRMTDLERAQFRRRAIELELDRGHGSLTLKDPRAARIVKDALLFFDQERYSLEAWTVMPNHVHVLYETSPRYPLDKVLHSWKSFTSKEINKILGRRGILWQEEYYDRFVRNAKHYANCVSYIEENPVKAGLCKTRQEWKWGSAGVSSLRT